MQVAQMRPSRDRVSRDGATTLGVSGKVGAGLLGLFLAAAACAQNRAQASHTKNSPTQSAVGNQPGAAAAAPANSTSVASLMMRSVSILNSPGVPDLGGHCIICGLVTGNLTAVEPNLVICVTPTGTKEGHRQCTTICQPGHDCKKNLGDGVSLNGAKPSVHVEVLDDDKEGKVRQLAAFDEDDPIKCTTAQPCKVADADDQGAGTLVSFGFGKGRPPSQGCHGPYASVDQAMMRDSAGPQALKATEAAGDDKIEYGFLIVRDPSQKSGGYYTTPPIRGQHFNSEGISIFTKDDYDSSLQKASCGTKDLAHFNPAAAVHTHPIRLLNQNFTPNDFEFGIELKINGPDKFEKMVMIYAGDHKVRTFAPTVNDPQWTALELKALNYLPLSGQWLKYVDRTQIIGTYQ